MSSVFLRLKIDMALNNLTERAWDFAARIRALLILRESGMDPESIARALAQSSQWVADALDMARHGEARTLLGHGRLESVEAWQRYLRLTRAARRVVLDGVPPVSVDRCRAARGESRAQVQRRARAPKLGRPRKLSTEQSVEAMRRIDAGERATAVAAALGVSSATLFRALYHHRPVKARRKKASAAEPAAPRGARFQTYEAALDAFHLEAHEERDALIAGLDGVREGLDTLLTTMDGSAEITDPVFEVLRAALAPLQRVLDAALKKIIRPPEFPPCCVLNAAARHAERDARGEGTRRRVAAKQNPSPSPPHRPPSR